MIGVFDSGLGGLTVVRRVRERLPQSDVVFFADQAHVPYGDRTEDDLRNLVIHNLEWLDDRGVDAIVMGCNTSCAIADRFGWPTTRATILDLIESATIAVERGGHRRIGVVATAATIRSGAYGRRIRSAITGAEVFEVAAPALVPLVEAGSIEGPEPRAAVTAVCEQLPNSIDAIVMACTHYPLLEAHFAAVLGESVARIDPAIVQADRVAALLEPLGATQETGRTQYVTNGDLNAFRANVARLMKEPEPVAIIR